MGSPTRARHRLAIAIALACACGPVAAATATADDAAVELDAIVVVASRAPEPLAQVQASVTVVERDRMERELAQDIDDLVRYVPGVRVDADANRFGRQGFSIRGLGGNRVRVEIDGVPVPDAFAVGQFAAAGRDLADLEAIERVEILRGPASTLYGSDALAGIVALRTRSPEDLLARGDGTRHAGVRAGWAGRDDSRLLGASWAGATANGWEAMALYARRDGHETGNLAWREQDAANPADYRRESFLGKLVRDAGEHGRWTLILDHGEQSQRTDVRSQRFAPGRFATTYRLDADDRAERDRVSVQGEWTSPVPWLDRLELFAYAQRSDVRQDSAQYRLPDRATPFESLRWRRFDHGQREAGIDLVGQSRGEFLGARHWQVFGIELERTRYSGLRDGIETNLATGATSAVILGERFPVRDFPDSEARRIALFWQDEIRYGRLSVVPGLRWERYRLDAEPDALFVEDYPDIATVDVGEDNIAPRLGLRWSLSQRASLFAQYARGFRAPPFSDVNIGLFLPSFNYEVRPNPDLRPETSRGLEAGFRWHGEALQATLSAYENRYRDLIESRANLGIDPASGALVFQSVNRDRARIRGIEAEAGIDFGAWRGSLDGWRLRAAAAWSRGDDTARDVPLNSIDPASLVLGLGYDARDGRWGAELVGTGVRRKTRIDAGAGPLFAPPGHASFDLLAWYAPHERVRVNLGVFNLGDRRYWDWGGLRGVSATAANLGFYTRPGRSVALTVGLAF